MEKSKLEGLFESFCRAAEMVFRRDGYAQSIVFVFGANGEMVVVPVIEDKVATQVAVRMAMVKLNAEAVMQVGEVYMLKVGKEEPMPAGAVRDDPRSTEQMMVVLESKTINLIRTWDIAASDVAKRYLVRCHDEKCPDVMETRWSGDWFRRNEGRA